MSKDYKHQCENCGKNTRSDLYYRHNHERDYGIQFVCDKCFKRLNGCTFEQYGEKPEEIACQNLN